MRYADACAREKLFLADVGPIAPRPRRQLDRDKQTKRAQAELLKTFSILARISIRAWTDIDARLLLAIRFSS